jgi:hypothetical protein
LFLEGVEVPVISASVTVQPDMPASAAIQIVPTDMSMYLLPRTLVHLFYLDSSLTDAEYDEASKVYSKLKEYRPTSTVEDNDGNRQVHQDLAYKLLFVGEVIGINYRKTPLGRQTVLQCMDLSSYWDCCYQFFSDYSAGGNGLTDKHHQFVGAGEGIFDNLSGHDWVISRLLQSPPKSPEYQECKGLQGGLIHLLECVGGLRYRNDKFEGFKGVNDFFTIAELRYGLMSMLGAISADTTSAKLFSGKAFRTWLKNGMTSIGTLVSFRDMLNHVNRFIFHNIYPNPCARYVPGGTVKSKRVMVSTTSYVDASIGPGLRDDMSEVHVMLLKAEVALNFLAGDSRTATSPVADPLAYATDNTREALKILKLLIEGVDATQADNAEDISTELKSVKSNVSNALDSLPTLQPYSSEDTRFVGSGGGATSSTGETASKSKKAAGFLRSASSALWDLYTKEVAQYKPKSVEVPGASFLYNQLFFPEAFFVAPPKCNVIFPDQYFDLNFSRNFLREVTRLAAQAGLGMLGGGRQGAELFSRYYIAPNIRDVRGGLVFSTPSQGSKIILPHEVHTGIVPKFEWITDGHRWGVKAAYGSNASRPEKIHYLQRLANFQFFLHRWSARQLSVGGIFNPNIVAGLPGVVIDRSAPSPVVVQELEKILQRRMLPTQFVGKVMGFSHAIGQQGGSTSIQYGFARTHRGLDDEFMGILNKEVTTEKPADVLEVWPKLTVTSEDPAELRENQTGTESTETQKAQSKQRARVGKNIELRKSIVRLWTENKLAPPLTIPLLGKVKKVETKGKAQLLSDEAEELGISEAYFTKNAVVGDGSFGSPSEKHIVVPETITVTFNPIVGTGQFERSNLSFEDAVRPGWFMKDVWGNENITEKVYYPLLGSRSITDDSMSQEQQDELLKRWKADQQARITPTADGKTVVDVESLDSKFKITVAPGSVEEAIDSVSLLYSMTKEKGGNIHGFIRDYTKRPIANMVDILGSQSLEFDSTGKVKDPDTMIEGFHSRAFGDYNTDVQLPDREGGTSKAGKDALFNLMEGVANPATLKRTGMIDTKNTPRTPIRAELDPRGRARGRVRAYMEELKISRGLLGS